MTMITTVTQEQVTTMVEGPEARIARIANGIMDVSVFLPAGQVYGEVHYPSRNDRVIVAVHDNVFGITQADVKAVLVAVRDSPRQFQTRKTIAMIGVISWMSHVMMRGFGPDAHVRREAYRMALTDSVRRG